MKPRFTFAVVSMPNTVTVTCSNLELLKLVSNPDLMLEAAVCQQEQLDTEDKAVLDTVVAVPGTAVVVADTVVDVPELTEYQYTAAALGTAVESLVSLVPCRH